MSGKTIIKLSCYAVTAVLFVAGAAAQAKYSYEGTATCGMCHKSEKQGQQLKIWQESAHAKAFQTLLGEEAAKIAKEKGVGAADKAAACLKCHAITADAAQRGPKFKVEDGVQCETCHGPGSGYKTMKIMKDKNLAIQNGLMVHADGEKFCVTCHNSESPTFKGFKYAEAWAKIKHPVPAP